MYKKYNKKINETCQLALKHDISLADNDSFNTTKETEELENFLQKQSKELLLILLSLMYVGRDISTQKADGEYNPTTYDIENYFKDQYELQQLLANQNPIRSMLEKKYLGEYLQTAIEEMKIYYQ